MITIAESDQSFGDSVLGYLGQGMPRGEVAFRIKNPDGSPVRRRYFEWSMTRGDLPHQGSSSIFPDTGSGTVESDENGIIRIPITSRALVRGIPTFAPFPRFFTLVPQWDRTMKILDNRYIVVTSAPAAPIELVLEPGGGLGPQFIPGEPVPIPPQKVAAPAFPWRTILLVGGAILILAVVVLPILQAPGGRAAARARRLRRLRRPRRIRRVRRGGLRGVVAVAD